MPSRRTPRVGAPAAPAASRSPSRQSGRSRFRQSRTRWHHFSCGFETLIISNRPTAAREDVEVLADDGREARKDRTRDDGVSDRHFVEVRQVPEDDEIPEVEVVTRVDT